MIFGMLWVLPGILLLLSIVTLWFGIKLRLRWTIVCSNVTLALAFLVFAWNSYLVVAPFPPDNDKSLQYLVYSSVVCLLSLVVESFVFASQLLVRFLRRQDLRHE
jgi:hypothetical protein